MPTIVTCVLISPDGERTSYYLADSAGEAVIFPDGMLADIPAWLAHHCSIWFSDEVHPYRYRYGSETGPAVDSDYVPAGKEPLLPRGNWRKEVRHGDPYWLCHEKESGYRLINLRADNGMRRGYQERLKLPPSKRPRFKCLPHMEKTQP